MDVKKFEKIEKSFATDGIQALADRPNANNQYGVSGLSAQQLKARFDLMPEEIKLKVNAVIDGLYSDGGEYIPFSLDDTHKTVYDLLTAIGDGTLAKYLKSAVRAGEYKTLEDIAVSAVLSAALLGGHSVKKNVPENAEFTDTVYDDSALSGRIKEIEDKEHIWDAKQDAIPENTYDAYGSAEAVRDAVNSDLDKKLDKSLPNDPYNYIYGCNITGTFKRKLVNTPEWFGVPAYDQNGRIKTNAPSAGNDASNKEYVDAHASDETVHVSADQKTEWDEKQGKITSIGLLKGNGDGSVSSAVPGTDYQTPITFDEEPTEASTNSVTSGGVFKFVNKAISLENSIVQTTGQSTTAVMSQKAATDLFASKSDITDLQAALIGVSDLIGGDS